MAAVQNLPEQQGGVSTVDKMLYDHAVHTMKKEVVSTPNTSMVTKPKVHQSSVIRTLGWAAVLHSLSSNINE